MSDMDMTADTPAEEAIVDSPSETSADVAQDVAPVVDQVENDASESTVDSADADDSPADDSPAEDKAAQDATETAAVDAPVDVVDEDDLLEPPQDEAPVVLSPFDRPGRWYVVHTQSGHEKKAQQNLAARTASMNMEERIYESVIPMEDVVEFRNGKKVVVQKKMFPGYLLVRAQMDDDAWYVIRNTPSVVNFVGAAGKPSPLLRREVENFLAVKEEGAPAVPSKRSKARLEYELGETVRVKEGPFADFSGEIVELNEDQLKVKVLVNIFGRETPVELEFSQVARL